MKIIFNSHYTTTKRTPNPEIPGFIKIGLQTDVVKCTLFISIVFIWVLMIFLISALYYAYNTLNIIQSIVTVIT